MCLMHSEGFDQVDGSTMRAVTKEMAARREIRYLGLHQRVSVLCDRERMRICYLLLCCGVSLAVSEDEANFELEEVAILVLAMMCFMSENVRLERRPFPRVRRTIDQLTDTEAWTNFRFRKGDLPTILTAFAFPEDIPRVAGSRFEREELFFFFLRRMRY